MHSSHATPAASPEVRIVARLPREAAFGRACAHLMTRPAFARAPFGHIARTLAGQVNRGHYVFAARGDRTVGFAGWALTSEARAEAWLAGAGGFDDAEAAAGDCVVLNCWQADDAAVTRLIMAHLTATLPGARRLYAKRHYSDGRMRPLRLDVARRTAAPFLRPAHGASSPAAQSDYPAVCL
jgi:hemolysin-activating ACP:hemolysin acyltransferase